MLFFIQKQILGFFLFGALDQTHSLGCSGAELPSPVPTFRALIDRRSLSPVGSMQSKDKEPRCVTVVGAVTFSSGLFLSLPNNSQLAHCASSGSSFDSLKH